MHDLSFISSFPNSKFKFVQEKEREGGNSLQQPPLVGLQWLNCTHGDANKEIQNEDVVKVGLWRTRQDQAVKVFDFRSQGMGIEAPIFQLSSFASKCHFVVLDIFNGKKIEDIVPSSLNCVVCSTQLIDIYEDGFACRFSLNVVNHPVEIV
ncbi:hypothetical protein E3N88_14066 [Mikania micrantha]|uniref:Uncharacterized protein n=1 Tax=Mikania micrantha TaxID=192012 RepID=A0A5N6P313_9ASTR|nr:hypothetical protein E3N88_14066 [Mikania micrantha]